MKKFKLSAMLIFMSMLVFSACGGGGGGSDDPGKPGDPEDPNYTIEIRPANGTLYLNCEYEFFAVKENDSKHLDNITWVIDDASMAKIDADGKLTPLKAGKFKVTGTTAEGEIGMAECTVTSVAVSDVFSLSSGTIIRYKGSGENVAIPAVINGTAINSIGQNAFDSCNGMENLEIPSSITIIEKNAFRGCSSLETINIPSGVMEIGDSVFANCVGLKSIEVDLLNSKYKDIDGVLYNKDGTEILCLPVISNSNEVYVILPGVTNIGASAFRECGSLKSIQIPSSVTKIGDDAFNNCKSLESIKIPSGVTSIGENAFYYCTSLKSIEIPSGVTSIGGNAFYNCKSLESIIIPSGVTSIGSNAFYKCISLENIKIPSGVTSIGEYAFNYCTSLKSIELPSSMISIGWGAFQACRSLEAIEIPSGITIINFALFDNCSSLTGIEIPSLVSFIDVSAFSDCPNLYGIEVDPLNAYYKDIDGVLYNKAGTSLLKVLDKCIVNDAYVVPSGVTIIEREAFKDCSSLEILRVNALNPPSLESSYLFSGCSKLTKIEVPSASVAKYKSADGWKDYTTKIIGF